MTIAKEVEVIRGGENKQSEDRLEKQQVPRIEKNYEKAVTRYGGDSGQDQKIEEKGSS